MNPKFITFTGADDQTSIDGMIELSNQYPIEWGILFSPKRQGSGRYPSLDFVQRLTARRRLTLSAHLCGADARSVLESQKSQHAYLIRKNFARVQINSADPHIDTSEVFEWANALHVRAILQCRKSFPDDSLTDWLFDASGGRGIVPAAWPVPISERIHGYAGGLNHANVAEAVNVINGLSRNYWIDMETGVRDENDKFDLNLCRLVCEAVYLAKEPQ